MASKAVILVFACFLLINTKVSSEWEEEILTEGSTAGGPSYKSSPPPAPLPKSPSPPALATKAAPPSPPPPATKIPPPPPPAKASPPPPVTAPATPPPVQPPRNRQECIPLCTVRCKNHSRKNVCSRACLTCCERCKCVPPGQYGNKEKCGKCYTGMTTTGGRLKCP